MLWKTSAFKRASAYSGCALKPVSGAQVCLSGHTPHGVRADWHGLGAGRLDVKP